jgi:uncharacterized protein YcfJ
MNLHTKLIRSALCLGTLAVATAAGSASAAEFEDYGHVVRVQPRTEQINRPRQECKTEYVQVPVQQAPQERSAGGSIIGGIAGALIGNQIGGGTGRTTATAAGAIAGAIAGDRMDNNNRQLAPGPQQVTEQAVRQCRTVDAWESRPMTTAAATTPASWPTTPASASNCVCR